MESFKKRDIKHNGKTTKCSWVKLHASQIEKDEEEAVEYRVMMSMPHDHSNDWFSFGKSFSTYEKLHNLRSFSGSIHNLQLQPTLPISHSICM